jgi:hypothetical protein
MSAVEWHRVDRGDDLAWVGRRDGVAVAVVTHLADDAAWHPATIRDGGRRYDLPPQPRLHDALRYAELVLGDYWPPREQLELLTTAAPQLDLLPPARFLRVNSEGAE